MTSFTDHDINTDHDLLWNDEGFPYQNRESTEGCSKNTIRENNDKTVKSLVATSRTVAGP